MEVLDITRLPRSPVGMHDCLNVCLLHLPVAALRCQHALLISTSTVETLDMECQASDGLSDGQEVGVSYLHREHLEHELQTLCQERDNLVAHLNESTETFQGQLKLLADKGNMNFHPPPPPPPPISKWRMAKKNLPKLISQLKLTSAAA